MKDPIKKRILILDDDETLKDVLWEAIAYNTNYQVSAQRCDGDIYETINAYHPDVVIIDHVKLSQNDDQLCYAIERARMLTSIPFIILTAFPNAMASIGDYDRDDYLTKPFNLDELELKISNMVYRNKDVAPHSYM